MVEDEVGGTLYIGGAFSYVGPNTGSGAVISTSTGVPNSSYLKTNGNINAALADGSGGWYIGGEFTKVGSTTRNIIAHILSNGTVDPDFNPNADVNVLAFALSSDNNTLYVGGEFTTIGGQARSRIAALNTSDGLATAWNPNSSDLVRDLVLSSDGNTLYTGGQFLTIGGQARNRIAALSTSDGTASTTWNPNANGSVYNLELSSNGDTLYVGGGFSTIGGQSRGRIAALGAYDGLATAWNPNSNSVVHTLARSSDDSTLYVGGQFTIVGGQTRNRIAALNASDGLATAWNPDINSNVVQALKISSDGNTIYVGGSFFNVAVGGQTRYYVAAVDTSTALATAWNPDPNNSVVALALSPDNSNIFIGGEFFSVGGQRRNSIAAINTADGSASTTWNPNINNTVNAMVLSSDRDTLYVGGDFTTIGGQGRNYIGAINIADGTASTTWNPDSDSSIRALALTSDNNTIYAGGYFTSIGGQLRNYIAALDAYSGTASTTWNPNSDNSIYALTLSSDNSTLYAGGQYTTIGGQTRNRIAALGAYDGLATVWDPNADVEILAMALSSDNSTLYTGGAFTTIGGQTRNHIAALSVADGTASTTWNPNANNNNIYAIALSSDDSTLYAGGDFTTIGGETRNNVAALNISDGLATAWNPNANNYINGLTLSSDGNSIYIGGEFTTIGGVSQQRFAQFSGADTVDPTIAIGSPSASLTNDGPVTFTVTYGGADTVTLANANITLNTTGTATGDYNVSGSGVVTRIVTISNITGDGTLGISIAAGTASDTAGNTAAAAGPSTTFDVDNTAPSTPVASPVAGTFTSAQSITLTSSGSSIIRYTADGSVPTCSSGTLYSGAISVSASETIKAVGCDAADNSSALGTFAYVISVASGVADSGGIFGGGDGNLKVFKFGAVSVPSKTASPSEVALVVSPIFNTDLDFGNRGDDVKRLQELLSTDREIYPEGLITGYFGPLTQKAVIKFQKKHNLPQAGRVGPLTRAKLLEIFPASDITAPFATVEQLQAGIDSLAAQIQELLDAR